MKKHFTPDFSFERKVGSKFNLIIGVDEVGRGAIAGPVVAGACVVFKSQFGHSQKFREPRNLAIFNSIGVDDSKRLTAARREELARIIKRSAVWGIGEVGVSYINRMGIVNATEKAMRQAVRVVRNSITRRTLQRVTGDKEGKCFVLVDAFHVKYIPGVGLRNQKAIVKGDQKSISIAAASIIAKVQRDKLMVRLHRGNQGYRDYRWDKNKGYGTDEHWKAIRKFGVSRLHRKQFVESGLLLSSGAPSKTSKKR